MEPAKKSGEPPRAVPEAMNAVDVRPSPTSRSLPTPSPWRSHKVLGTVHIVLRHTMPYVDGHTKSKIHLDGVPFQPTVWVDELQSLELLV